MSEHRWYKVRCTVVVELEVPATSRQGAKELAKREIHIPWHAKIRSRRVRLQRMNVAKEEDWMIPDLSI